MPSCSCTIASKALLGGHKTRATRCPCASRRRRTGPAEIAFRRPQIARLYPAEIHNELLQYHARVHHPDFERVMARTRDRVSGPPDPRTVFHGGLPRLLIVVGE